MESAGTFVALSPWEPGIFSLAVYGFMVFALIAVFLFLCAWPGEKKASPEKATPYECGIIPAGSARIRYPVPFYLVAIFFLVFDVEAVFIFAWAIAFHDTRLDRLAADLVLHRHSLAQSLVRLEKRRARLEKETSRPSKT